MPKGRARTIIAAAIIVASVGFVVAGIVRDFDRIELDRVQWPFLGRASVVLLVAYAARALAFAALVRTMEPSAPIIPAARVFLASQLGRYIPGKVWQIAGAGYLASRVGISATSALVASAYYMVLHNLIGGLLGLGVFLSLSGLGTPSNTMAVAGVVGLSVVAFASSPAFPRLVRWVGTLVGRDLEVRAIPLWGVLFTVVSALVVWVLFGVAVVDAFRGTLPGSPVPDLASATANIAAASVAGLAVLIVPSGLGVREAVFVAAFSGSYSLAEGGLVALVLRVLMSGLELLLAVYGFAGTRGRTEPSEQDEPR